MSALHLPLLQVKQLWPRELRGLTSRKYRQLETPGLAQTLPVPAAPTWPLGVVWGGEAQGRLEARML